MVRWLRMVAELEADAGVQQMHRANIAKRQAARAARRAAMLARHHKVEIHLPMTWDRIEAVEGDENEWLKLRCMEAIKRLDKQGCDWLDYLNLHGAAGNDMIFHAFLDAQAALWRDDLGDAGANYSRVGDVLVYHPNSYSEWLGLGDHWRDEEIKQRFEESKGRTDGADRASRIEIAKQLAAEAKKFYQAAMAETEKARAA